ncbi:GntR family transcriptional regulator [Alteribacillus bidgolensis]|uniref:GntR family transcriptional regulator, gluconate operon transcriptional repressor n=1 Tax=Alteribacillus bidgolensis TaxID=930129 RepID=A0A1G8PKH1_9BACI|nr:GntR family transcriptional regulator [Alteribacillus bidgolensis]SDI92882.1 GntR family transcriptional regulator, gluconate operon transcriptional repressor [Alteribacillus bidgolensis]
MEFPVEKLDPHSKGEEIAGLMRYEIIAGQLKPGDFVSENSIAKKYNSSRSPSREALRILQNEGLLSLKRTGVEIIGISQKDIEELNDIRYLIESFAMKKCAEKNDEELIAFLQFTVEKMKIAIDKKDATELAIQDIAFHEAVIRASDHNRIYHLWKNIEKLIITALLIATKKRFSTEKKLQYKDFLIQSHLDIVNAIMVGDVDKIEENLQIHFLDTRATVRNSVFINNRVEKE